jgi:hypothetical protein
LNCLCYSIECYSIELEIQVKEIVEYVLEWFKAWSVCKWIGKLH